MRWAASNPPRWGRLLPLLAGIVYASSPNITPADTATVDTGISLFKQHRFKHSFALLMPKAHQGDPRAQFYLGLLYDMGSIELMDKRKAVYWYRKAADQGHARAQYDMGVMLSKGEGIGKDLKKAILWYRKAAHQHNPHAMYNLGVIHERGYGTDINLSRAIDWYTHAAPVLPQAAYNLAILYRRDPTLAHDPTAVQRYLTLAAHHHYAPAQRQLGSMYQQGIEVDRNLSQAAYWYREAAIQGDRPAQNLLGNLLKKEGNTEEGDWWIAHSHPGNADQ